MVGENIQSSSCDLNICQNITEWFWGVYFAQHVKWDTGVHSEVLAVVLVMLKPVKICRWFQWRLRFLPSSPSPEQQGLEMWDSKLAWLLFWISYNSSVAFQAHISGTAADDKGKLMLCGDKTRWTGSSYMAFPCGTHWRETSFLCSSIKGKEKNIYGSVVTCVF